MRWDCLLLVSLSTLLSFLQIWLLLVWLVSKAIHFTHKLRAWVINVIIKTCYYSHKSDFFRPDWSLRQFTSFINCTLDFIIHLGPNTVMTAGLSNHKFRFIYYFKFVHYWEKLSSNRGSIKKLWYWRSKSRSNCVQSTILLPLHSRLPWWYDKC